MIKNCQGNGEKIYDRLRRTFSMIRQEYTSAIPKITLKVSAKEINNTVEAGRLVPSRFLLGYLEDSLSQNVISPP